MHPHPQSAAPHRNRLGERQRLVANLSRFVHDRRVRDAMRHIPRELFVPVIHRHSAYADSPLPIGHGQTISQPLMVALMLQAAEIAEKDRVLEVGAGSGYQAALLGCLAREVYAIELLSELIQPAETAIRQAGVQNVTLIQGDGSKGYEPAAPYDAIVVAAAAEHPPRALIEQLAEGGRLVMPVGDSISQSLTRIRKLDGNIGTEDLGACIFVPLIETS